MLHRTDDLNSYETEVCVWGGEEISLITIMNNNNDNNNYIIISTGERLKFIIRRHR